MASASVQTGDSEIIIQSTESTAASNANLSTVPLYIQLLALEEDRGVITNSKAFDCIICLTTIDKDDGVRLRNCLHQFCLDCLRNAIKHCEEADVACPFGDGNSRCESILQDREIRAILSQAEFDQYLIRTLRIAEITARGAIHCKLVNCDGWCICEDGVNEFKCPRCESVNCVSCQAIHTGRNCKEYQDEINYGNLDDSERTKFHLDDIVVKNLGMKCPKCQIVIMKRDGCDWLLCSMCRTEICWVTKQARWGPNGRGDTSGGCQCKLNGNLCHPQCGNCH